MEASELPPEFIKTDQITDLWSFIQTIDWSEGWLVCLIVFHILLTIITLLTRNHHTIQAILFFILLFIVRCSQYINSFGAENWQLFSRQQYFDSQGLFISVVFSMPVLFNCMMMVMNWLWLSSCMMVTWKKAEIEARIRSNTHTKHAHDKHAHDKHAHGNVTHAHGNVTHAHGDITHAHGDITHAHGGPTRTREADAHTGKVTRRNIGSSTESSPSLVSLDTHACTRGLDAHTDGVETGDAHTEGAETGDAQTEGVQTRDAHTGCAETGDTHTEGAETGDAHTESVQTLDAHTDSLNAHTESQETGDAHMGSAENLNAHMDSLDAHTDTHTDENKKNN